MCSSDLTESMHGSRKSFTERKHLRNGIRNVRFSCRRSRKQDDTSKVLPCGAGAGSHTSCKPAQSRRSQTAARGAPNRPAVTSDPPLLPRPTGERGGQPCRRHATAPSGRASPTPNAPAWRPRPTRHATGVPDAAYNRLWYSSIDNDLPIL